MRIALLTDGIFPFVVGGMQKHSLMLAKYLARAGVHVDLYHCMSDGADSEHNLTDVFTVDELKNIEDIRIPFPPPGKIPGHYVRRSYKYSKAIFEALTARKTVDFIYAQGFAGWFTMERRKKDKAVPPVGVNFHGLNMFQDSHGLRASLENTMLRRPVEKNLANADIVFSLGGVLSSIQRGLVWDPKRVVDVPNGIEADWVVDEPRKISPRTFLWIGRYDKVKGIEDFHQAIKGLSVDSGLAETIGTMHTAIVEDRGLGALFPASELPTLEFKVHIVGPIPKEKQLQNKRVTYHGQVTDQAEMRKIAAQCDVLVNSSHSEGMPTVVLEGMAQGLATIATDVGATSVLVDEDTGVLYKPGSSAYIRLQMNMMTAVRMSEQELTRLRRNAIQKVKEDFLWEKVVAKTLKHIEEQLSNNS